MTGRMYIQNMHNTNSKMNSLYTAILSNRKYQRASENPVAAGRAYTYSTYLENVSTYKENLTSARGVLDTADEVLRENVSPQIASAYTKLLDAANGDKSQEERDAIANELAGIANQLVSTLNYSYAGRNLFAGTSNTEPPFSVTGDIDTGFVLRYNGVPVNTEAQVTPPGIGMDFSKAVANTNYTVSMTSLDQRTSPSVETTVNVTFSGGADAAATQQNFLTALNAATPASGKFSINADGRLVSDGGNAVSYTLKEGTGTSGGLEAIGLSHTTTGVNKETGSFNGSPLATNQINQKNHLNFPGANPIYVDVGLGIKYDSTGKVIPSTAMNIAISGVEMTGSGLDEETGLPNNAIQAIFDAATALRNCEKIDGSQKLEGAEFEKIMALHDQITKDQSTVLMGLNSLGVRSSAVDFYEGKMNQDEITYETAVVKAVGMDTLDQAKYITRFKSIEAAYNASLQLGSRVIPNSIFDFIR